jgi:protein MAK11
VGPHAWKGLSEYEVGKRYISFCACLGSNNANRLMVEGEIVRWSTDGSRFVVQAQSTIDVYTTVRQVLHPNGLWLTKIQDTTLLHTVAHPSRLHDVKFCRPKGFSEVLLAAAEDGKLSMYDVPEDKEKPPKIIAEMIGHSNRLATNSPVPVGVPLTSDIQCESS